MSQQHQQKQQALTECDAFLKARSSSVQVTIYSNKFFYVKFFTVITWLKDVSFIVLLILYTIYSSP